MKLVVDTNVVFSAVFLSGTPGRVLAAWSAAKFAMVLSPAILDEYRRVGHDLGHRHPELNAAFEPALTLITMNAIIVDAPGLDGPVSAEGTVTGNRWTNGAHDEHIVHH